MRKLPITISLTVSLLALGATAGHGQGRGPYMNVESPQVHPIEVASIGGHDYLLAVNTPDNALEIWDTDESIPQAQRFLARVRTGLEPVTVRWVASLERAFVVNFLGDSITAITIGAPTGPASLSATVVTTAPVTDEPLDLTFTSTSDPGGLVASTLYVTHMALDAYSKLNALTLAPIAAGDERLAALVASGQDLDFDGKNDDIALKEPWAPKIFCDQLFILGHKGGNSARYDFDLYIAPLAGGPARAVANIGSTNWNMAFSSGGDLYIVGAQSRNKNLIGEAAVAAANTGFVKSMFYLVENPCSGAPIIHRRDINKRKIAIQVTDPVQATPTSGGMGPDGKMVIQPVTGPVPFNQALAQPTSLVPFERTGQPTKVFFTAMGSDRVGVIEPSASVSPIAWPRRKIDITPVTPGAMAGPRGIALRPASADGTQPARLYVLNRIDPSITVIDPVSETEVVGMSFPLATTNIEPPEVLAGRRILYDARKSGNGFVSCSSCHTDGRTDGQAWQLANFTSVSIPPDLDQVQQGSWPADKGFMVTQSLQGLLNFEVPPDIQFLYSNKPYHWRGDQQDFQAFNGAFASLLGGSILPQSEIAAFEEFANTIHYPPNPQESKTRTYSGTLGDPNDPLGGVITGNHSGSGALKGLKLFHTANSDGFSCDGCHDTPEGSDNVLTEVIAGVDPFPLLAPPFTQAPPQPVETAALRGLLQKEARLDLDGSSFPENSPITGYEGLFHTGLDNSRNNTQDFHGTATMNAFNLRFFDVPLCTGAGEPSFCDNLQSVNQYLHEFDWGVGPIIGKAFTVTTANAGSAQTARAFADAEEQAELANAGAVVQAWVGGAKRGFWFDLTGNSGATPVYVEEPSGAVFTRANLLSLLSSSRDRLVLQSTPLGTERRMAAPDGQPVLLAGPTPTQAVLQGMVPNTANALIPSLSQFWDTGNIVNAGSHGHTTRLYQQAILFFAGSGAFNVCSVRHEAPRRFQLAAQGLRHGAMLHLWVPAGIQPPNTALAPDDPQQVAMLELVLPLHPTGDRLGDGSILWDTAAELDARILYRLLSGPPVDPLILGILDNLNDRDFQFLLPEDMSLYPAGSWIPNRFNQHFVRVVNTDGSRLDGGWQQLSIAKGPDCP